MATTVQPTEKFFVAELGQIAKTVEQELNSKESSPDAEDWRKVFVHAQVLRRGEGLLFYAHENRTIVYVWYDIKGVEGTFKVFRGGQDYLNAEPFMMLKFSITSGSGADFYESIAVLIVDEIEKPSNFTGGSRPVAVTVPMVSA